jgi:cell division protein FtsL
MNKRLFIRLSILIIFLSSCLYLYIDKQNYLTSLRISLFEVEKKIAVIQEENKRLQYEIEQFESPSHLMDLARSIEFSHLQHPFVENILSVKEGVALEDPKQNLEQSQKKVPIAAGAK